MFYDFQSALVRGPLRERAGHLKKGHWTQQTQRNHRLFRNRGKSPASNSYCLRTIARPRSERFRVALLCGPNAEEALLQAPLPTTAWPPQDLADALVIEPQACWPRFVDTDAKCSFPSPFSTFPALTGSTTSCVLWAAADSVLYPTKGSCAGHVLPRKHLPPKSDIRKSARPTQMYLKVIGPWVLRSKHIDTSHSVD